MASDTSLVFNLLAKDQVSKTLGTVKGNIGKLGVAITGLAVGAGTGLAKVGGDFDDAFDSIHTATGAIGSDMDALKQDFKAAFAQVPNDMPTVADALGQLNTLTGATGEELQDMTVSVTEAARLLGGDASDAAAKFGGQMKLWQVDAKDGPALMDSLFAATQKYNSSLSSITGALEKYGPVLKNTGFSLHETIGFMGQLEAAGIQIGRVMPGINAATRKWASEGVTDMRGALIEAGAAIRDAESDVEGLNIASEVFGAQGAQRLAAAIRSGALDLENLADGIEGMDGLIATTADETNDWAEKLQLLKNEGLVAIEPIASKVFDLMGEGIDKFKSLVEWGKENTGVVKALGVALGVLGGTILAVNIGMKAFAVAMAVKKAVVVAATAVQWLWNVAMTANPIGIVIVLIGLLVGAIVWIATKTDWFQKLWGWAWGGIKAAALAVWGWIKGTLWENGIKKYFQLMGNIASWLWGAVKKYFGFWKGLLDKVIGWVVGVWTKAKENFDKIVNFVKGLPGRIRKAASGLWDGIKDSFRAALNWVIDKWNGLSFTLPSITAFGRTIGGATLSTPNIPRLAKGGIVTAPTLAMIGEGNRHEAVIPLPRGGGAGGMLGGTTVVEVYLDGQRVEGATVRTVTKRLRTDHGFRRDVAAAVARG